MKKIFPDELLEMFETKFEQVFPLPVHEGGIDYDWKFYAATGILKCSLRDVQGNEADFEWDVTQKTL